MKNSLKQLLEAEKPPKPVLYKPWRLRKASEVIQSEPKGQKMRTATKAHAPTQALVTGNMIIPQRAGQNTLLRMESTTL